MQFAISALRAVIEMLGLSLLAQACLYLICGTRRESNVIYQLFSLITRFPCRLVAKPLPAATPHWAIGAICVALLFILWVGLAMLRSFL